MPRGIAPRDAVSGTNIDAVVLPYPDLTRSTSTTSTTRCPVIAARDLLQEPPSESIIIADRFVFWPWNWAPSHITLGWVTIHALDGFPLSCCLHPAPAADGLSTN